ncbi:PAS domain S-box protein [Dongia sp.]|uniref:PAS domain S-box protein n=1 Tax=Dongia sp. TaxID=1977262 RepID=UPI003753C9A4
MSGEDRYREIFDAAPVSLWDEDFSAVVVFLDRLRAEGVIDLRTHLAAHPEHVEEAIRRVRIIDVNAFTLGLFEVERKQDLLQSLGRIFLPETAAVFVDVLVTLWNGHRRFEGETRMCTLTGRAIEIAFSIRFHGARFERTLASVQDITAQKTAERALLRQSRRLERLNQIARSVATDIDNLERVVQTVTDAATELCGAKFGAFFYNRRDEAGESYTLFTLSGAPRSAFEKFGLPRNTPIFETTFRGLGTVRSDDIRKDPRYGHNPPHRGMPQGHLPVVSYLAVPVISSTGEVHGGLFFGHDAPGVFTSDAEAIIEAVASHAAIALDNERLLRTLRMESEQRRATALTSSRLAAIVETSDDAILTKDLDGIITSWNQGATDLFGYSAEEAIGKPVTMLIPADLQNEEPSILERIRAGERIEHYETVRQRKDGTLVDLSLSVSPLKDSAGTVVGASKIARDITERNRGQEQERLLIREMNHRIKNLFALASSIISLSARDADSPQALKTRATERLAALARVHSLTLSRHGQDEATVAAPTTLHALIRAILAPYEMGAEGGRRIRLTGDDLQLSASATTSFALLMHEFATNAAKYGALSDERGTIAIDITQNGDRLIVTWVERGGPPVSPPTSSEGFGGYLAKATVRTLDGQIAHSWDAAGVTVRLDVSRARAQI